MTESIPHKVGGEHLPRPGAKADDTGPLMPPKRQLVDAAVLRPVPARKAEGKSLLRECEAGGIGAPRPSSIAEASALHDAGRRRARYVGEVVFANGSDPGISETAASRGR
jgi:hypothetical protein